MFPVEKTKDPITDKQEIPFVATLHRREKDVRLR